MPVCTHQKKKKKTDKHNESDYTNYITEFASEHIQAVVHCKLSVVFFLFPCYCCNSAATGCRIELPKPLQNNASLRRMCGTVQYKIHTNKCK